MGQHSYQLREKRRNGFRMRILLYISSIAGMIVIFLFILAFWWSLMLSSIHVDTSEFMSKQQQKIAVQIQNDIEYLAKTIGERNMHTPGTMDRTVDFLQKRFKEAGYFAENQNYIVQQGVYTGKTAKNLIAEIPATGNQTEIIVIGAHYDTVKGSPGANDNASGVAVLLAAAEKLGKYSSQNTIRFVAFANEEPPFFQTSDMGSYAYAEKSSQKNEKITAMIALDGLGYYDRSSGSQSYPLPGLGFIYSDRADFIALVTRFSDLSLLRNISAGFEESGVVATESAALPGFLPGVNWSDHWSFWKFGYPGVLITDTLLFRDPHYHTPRDTPERLNYSNMARITTALVSTIKKIDSKK